MTWRAGSRLKSIRPPARSAMRDQLREAGLLQVGDRIQALDRDRLPVEQQAADARVVEVELEPHEFRVADPERRLHRGGERSGRAEQDRLPSAADLGEQTGERAGAAVAKRRIGLDAGE